MHLLHWGSYRALWNVGLLIWGQSLLYCVNNLKMAVWCGQSIHGFTPSWVCSSLRVVQMCTLPLSHPPQMQGVTQSPCWLSLLCWHWSRTLLQVKVLACVRTQLLSWHAVHCVCFCIVLLSLLCLCVSWVVSREGKGDSEAGRCDLVLSMITVKEHQECQNS